MKSDDTLNEDENNLVNATSCLMEANNLLEEMITKGYDKIRIGPFFGKYEIWMYNKKDLTPYFHVIVGDHSEPELHSCIRCESATYFMQEDAKDILNGEEKKELIKFLNGKHKQFDSNWLWIVNKWKSNNPDSDIPDNLEMPNYMELE